MAAILKCQFGKFLSFSTFKKEFQGWKRFENHFNINRVTRISIMVKSFQPLFFSLPPLILIFDKNKKNGTVTWIISDTFCYYNFALWWFLFFDGHLGMTFSKKNFTLNICNKKKFQQWKRYWNWWKIKETIVFLIFLKKLSMADNCSTRGVLRRPGLKPPQAFRSVSWSKLM